MIDMAQRRRMIEVLDILRDDLDHDLKRLDGKEFSAVNVAVMFGRQAAAIDALARMIHEILSEGL